MELRRACGKEKRETQLDFDHEGKGGMWGLVDHVEDGWSPWMDRETVAGHGKGILERPPQAVLWGEGS